MSIRKFSPVVITFLSVFLLVGLSGLKVAAAGSGRHTHHVQRVSTVHYFGAHRPLYGYYSRHGQYVPGAGDRLIYGPGYVFVPGRGILGEACNLPTSTCTNEYRDIR